MFIFVKDIYFSDFGITTYGDPKVNKISVDIDELLKKLLTQLHEAEDYKEIENIPDEYKIEYDSPDTFNIVRYVNKFKYYRDKFYPESSR